MRGKLFMAAVSAVALMAGAPGAHADTTDDLLKRLLEKGILTQAEYDQLTARKAQEAPVATGALPTPAPGLPATGGATTEATVATTDKTTPAAAIDPRAVRMSDSGLGMQMGPVLFKVSGSVNGFYTHDSGDKPAADRAVVGGLATVGGDTSSIRNGLLPGFIRFDVTSVQNGFTIGAHFGLYPGINSVTDVGGANSAGSPSALSTSGIDARQTYLTVARADLGELKIGRDIGLFGSDAILNDITLLGVGTAAGNSAPSNTSIGRIGVGYIYTDFMPQITYTSPTFGGFQGALGVFQPLTTAGATEENNEVGFQGKLTYAHAMGEANLKLWLDFVSQKHDATLVAPAYTGSGFDVGAKLGFGPVSLVGYAYDGTGIGTTGLFILSTDLAGKKRDSHGFYVQGGYTFAKTFTLSGSYGESRLDLASGEINPTLLKSNSSYVVQGKYALTSWFNFIGEYTHSTADAQGPNSASSDSLALGGILFF